MVPSRKTIRVGLFCRVLPHYRVPIYERLSQEEGIGLTVFYSKEPPYYSLKSVDPGERFNNKRIPMRAVRIGNQEILFQPDLKRLVSKFDVVIFSANPRLLSNYPALYQARRKGVGIVWWTLGIMPRQSPTALAIKTRLMRFPDSVVVYTEREKEVFVSKGISSSKIFVAQNTMDVSSQLALAEQWTPSRVEEFRGTHGLTNKHVFLFCSQLRSKKRIDLLLEAFALLQKKRTDVHLVIIGGGEAESLMKAHAARLGVGDCISWLGPIYDPQDLAPWYMSAIAHVVPHAIGLAAYQSFAFGLPCITTADRSKQTPECVGLEDGYNSLLHEAENAEDIASKMECLISDERLRQKLATNAKRTMTEVYTTDRMVAGLLDAVRFSLNNSS